MAIPDAAVQHYRSEQQLQAIVLASARRAWRNIEPRFVLESWAEQLAMLLPVVVAGQERSAFEGGTYSAMTLAQQGDYVPPDDFTNPVAFSGYASDGRDLDSLLTTPARASSALIDQGAAPSVALALGVERLSRIVVTQIADAGRQAGGVDIAARRGVGYTRMVAGGACSRCIVLAGRFYRWNKGFLRHPRCLCKHVSTKAGDTAEAYANGLIDDPYEAFGRLSEAEQDRVFGVSNAQAIRDGADLSQVVNSRRGMTANGLFTSEGTTKRGNASLLLKPGQRRLTPEGIYEQAERFGKDRAWTLDRLREHGYLLPKGQVPTGALRGQVEGWGQLGGGGQRRAAREAIEEARRTGVRDPMNRYTMTAAERRLYVARRRYETALSGTSPYTSPGFGNTPDPYGLGLNAGGVSRRRVTPIELARAEREYRALLASRGQIFTA